MKFTFKDFVGEIPVPASLQVIEEHVEPVVEPPKPSIFKKKAEPQEPLPDTPSEPSLIDRASEHLKMAVIKEQQQNSYQQPIIPTIGNNMMEVVNKLKYLEAWLAKISAQGPGGGAGDVINLDHPVTLTTGDYTITRRDYYVGVNAQGMANITLLDSIGFPGRKLIIKDESGNCANNPIVVSGTVDNDPGGFILQQNNGGIQMIYREGWRII